MSIEAKEREERAAAEDEMTYVGDNESVFFKAQKDAGLSQMDDAVTVATSAVEALSVYSGPVGAGTTAISTVYSK